MANNGMLRVNFDEMAQAGTDIQNALNSLTNDLEVLEKEGGKLTADWVGKAKQSYEERQAIWRDASRSLQSILQSIQRAVVDSTDDYLSTEQQAARRFQ